MRVVVKYGTGNELARDYPAGTTVGCVVNNASTRAALGYGQSVQGHVGGVPQSDSTQCFEGMVISVNDKSCSKAG
jgi:hypothetical protein